MPSLPLLFNIDPNNLQSGITLNDNKNRASISLQQPLHLDKLKNPRLNLLSFNCFFTFPNVNQGAQIEFLSGDGDDWKVEETLVFDSGLYSIEGIDSVVSNFIEQNPIAGFSDLTVNFQGNYNTERVEVLVSSTDLSNANQLQIRIVDLKLQETLGFNELSFSSSGIKSAPNQAHINDVNSLVLTTDLLNQSTAPSVFNSRHNTKYLASVNIDASPGAQILYTPNFKSDFSMNNAVTFNSIDIVVLDERLRDVKMTNPWSFFMSIDYD